MAQRRPRRSQEEMPRCEDCYFKRNMLCALQLDEPCATFRPDRPEGLVPPRQPVLLMRAPRWASNGASAEPATRTEALAEPAAGSTAFAEPALSAGR